ncbi:MAG: zf-HC2 domain-containing protein [Chloroflexi bacterium]|nr:zf-HC2 domain-containing protein [Chloroflexota bacterium]
MNHQPFEEWLLDDKPLNPIERRELDLHLRTCARCASLAEIGLTLRSAPVVSPAAGFTLRFQERLAAQKIAERRRRLWGLMVLLIAGSGLLAWLLVPYILAFASAPVEWMTAGIGYFLFLITSFQALTEAAAVLLRMAANFIPPYVWMTLASALAGLGLLWTISIWQFSRTAQGVSA